MKYALISLMALLAACAPRPHPESLASDIPSGTYTMDRAHASLLFRVNHMGFSHYTARFKHFEATLTFDPKNPTASQVTATIDPRSLETDYPNPKKINFNAELQGKSWLDAKQFPAISFRSTRVELTGKNSARITGDFTLHGITKPVALSATFNGGYAGNPMDPAGSRVGFSAHGSFKRSDFGIGFGIPAPGSNMGVGNEVEVIIEAEFTRPTSPAAK
jgi:polyisoprenoid-binding protein YceI